MLQTSGSTLLDVIKFIIINLKWFLVLWFCHCESRAQRSVEHNTHLVTTLTLKHRKIISSGVYKFLQKGEPMPLHLDRIKSPAVNK